MPIKLAARHQSLWMYRSLPFHMLSELFTRLKQMIYSLWPLNTHQLLHLPEIPLQFPGQFYQATEIRVKRTRTVVVRTGEPDNALPRVYQQSYTDMAKNWAHRWILYPSINVQIPNGIGGFIVNNYIQRYCVTVK